MLGQVVGVLTLIQRPGDDDQLFGPSVFLVVVAVLLVLPCLAFVLIEQQVITSLLVSLPLPVSRWLSLSLPLALPHTLSHWLSLTSSDPLSNVCLESTSQCIGTTSIHALYESPVNTQELLVDI